MTCERVVFAGKKEETLDSLDSLQRLGWSNFFEEQLTGDLQKKGVVARVIGQGRGLYRLDRGEQRCTAEIAGRLRHEAGSEATLPAVGDWVLVRLPEGEERGRIEGVLERKSKLSRKAAGRKTQEQVVAANVDHVFLITSLNRDLNPRRIERYLTLLWESGAQPAVLLNKADLCSASEVEQAIREIEAVAWGVPVLALSAALGTGVEQLESLLQQGQTIALLGSSGVGKSTLLNLLLGEERQQVRSIRKDDDRGRHTTTSRELIALPNGALIIDTPGMRELQLWEDDGALQQVFEDIEELASACRFRDCQHQGEPGCAVEEALACGELEEHRFQSYLKLQRELAYQERKKDVFARQAMKKKWKNCRAIAHQIRREREG